MLTIALPEELEHHFEPLAKAAGKTIEAYVQNILIEYMEDAEDLLVAEQRMADLRAGKTKTVPLQEVMKEYGMEY